MTSKVETDQSDDSGAPNDTCPLVRTGLKSVNRTPPESDALSRLSRRQRDVVSLRYLADRSEKEVAWILRISTESVAWSSG